MSLQMTKERAIRFPLRKKLTRKFIHREELKSMNEMHFENNPGKSNDDDYNEWLQEYKLIYQSYILERS